MTTPGFGYVPLPVDTDPRSILAGLLADLAALRPDWTPAEADPETALLQVVAGSQARLMALLAQRADQLWLELGQDFWSITPLAGASASLTVTFTVTAPGGTVPGGTRVRASTLDGSFLFTLASPVTAASGATTVTALLTAVEVGSAPNGATSAALAAATPGVVSAVETGPASGGADAETIEQYRNRVAADLPLRRATPHFADEFAAAARNVPGVRRAFAIAGYDATTDTNVGATVSVYPVDEDGLVVPPAVATAVQEALSDPAHRALNMVVRVAQPTYTAVAVAFTATAAAGYDAGAVTAAAKAAVRSWLHPAGWAGGYLEPPAWTTDATVRLFDVADVLLDVEGLQRLDTLTLNGGTVNVTLAGKVPLPAHPEAATPSSVTGTVSAP